MTLIVVEEVLLPQPAAALEGGDDGRGIPGARDDVFRVATPLLVAAVPRVRVPSVKVTEPAGVPAAVLFTRAVSVTEVPSMAEVGEAVRLVVVATAGTQAATPRARTTTRSASPSRVA